MDSVLQQAVTESGRPVGIVIRQAASPSEVDLLTSLMGHSGVHSQAEADDAYNPLDMFGLGGLAGAAAAAEEQRQQSWADLLHHLMMNDPNRVSIILSPVVLFGERDELTLSNACALRNHHPVRSSSRSEGGD